MFWKLIFFLNIVKITQNNIIFARALEYGKYDDGEKKTEDYSYEQLIEQFKQLTTTEVNNGIEVGASNNPNQEKIYFNIFVQHFKKTYVGAQIEWAFNNFRNNLNLMIKLGEFIKSAKFKINEFTDLTLEEFTTYYTGFNDTKIDGVGDDSDVIQYKQETSDTIPRELDWSAMSDKYHLEARHQGLCKNSYICSAVANIEFQIMRKHNYNPSYFSIQQAYDCELTGNCSRGGLPHLVMEYFLNSRGVVLDEVRGNNRPYEMSWKKDNCSRWKTIQKAARVKSVIRFKVRDENELAAALYEYGPITTAIYVSEGVKNYRSGILTGINCNKKPNHAVLIVGYGGSDSTPYWIIRNSWGTLWGELGYLFLVRGRRACGIGGYLVTVTVQTTLRKRSKSTKPTTTSKKPTLSTYDSITVSQRDPNDEVTFNPKFTLPDSYYATRPANHTTTKKLITSDNIPTSENNATEATNASETTQPTEATNASETTQPTEATNASEITQPTEATNASEASVSSEINNQDINKTALRSINGPDSPFPREQELTILSSSSSSDSKSEQVETVWENDEVKTQTENINNAASSSSEVETETMSAIITSKSILDVSSSESSSDVS